MDSTSSPAAESEDLYGSDADAESPAEDKAEGSEESGDSKSDATEGMLPKALFGGRELKVGQKETVEITGVHDGQVSVKCLYGGKDKGGDNAEGESDMPSGMGSGNSNYD